ncbi:MAG: MSCRAMM family protein, partial [Blastocatellia bacterium]
MRLFFSNLSLAIFCAAASFIVSNAQTGTITGRIVYEDGGGAPNTTIMLTSVKANQQPASARGVGDRAVTDEEGKFKFTGLAPGVYMTSTFDSKGYVREPSSAAEMREQRYCRVGDNVTITMIRGGVITGRVTTAIGEPMAGVRVYPVMVRDAAGHPVRRQPGGRPRMTDDRGIYRLYGLAPGTYVVYTRPETLGPSGSPYEGNVPTYHPSSTHDTAAEIAVTSGGEATGIDIRYRGERGRVVSGTVAGVTEAPSTYNNVGVSLISLSTGNIISSSGVRPGGNANAFAIYGVPDGDYEIIARRGEFNSNEMSASSPRRVTVKGADVTGIEWRLSPMASISGKIVLEATQSACENRRKSTLEEVALSARREVGAGGGVDPFSLFLQEGSANDKGDFSIYNLQPARYFIEPRLPNENWFVKSIAASAPPAAANIRRAAKPSASTDIARSGITLKSGENLTGLTLTVADGAAGLRGKVAAEKEGAQLLSRLRVHLTPAEDAASDDVLRYVETVVRGDGSFVLNNLAPGKYWLVARAAPDDEPSDRPPMPVAWDANERAKLRREAMAAKNEIELALCGRMKDY